VVEHAFPGNAGARRSEGQREDWHVLRKGCLDLRPIVAAVAELADDQQSNISMVQDIADRVAAHRRVDRHADQSSHHDRDVSDHPVRAVLTYQRDPAAPRYPERHQLSGEAASILACRRPSEVYEISAGWLRQKDSVALYCFPVEKMMQQCCSCRNSLHDRTAT